MPRILVIDDDEAFRLTIGRVLRAEGYDATLASDGSKGLAEYRKEPPDVVLVDLVMPEKEGLETISELRREFPDSKVIGMTGHPSMVPMLNAALRFGAIRRTSKTFRKRRAACADSQERGLDRDRLISQNRFNGLSQMVSHINFVQKGRSTR